MSLYQTQTCLLQVCSNPRAGMPKVPCLMARMTKVPCLMRVLVDERTMKVFRGEALTQVFPKMLCLMRVCSNPRGAICLTRV